MSFLLDSEPGDAFNDSVRRLEESSGGICHCKYSIGFTRRQAPVPEEKRRRLFVDIELPESFFSIIEAFTGGFHPWAVILDPEPKFAAASAL